jgi:hypothetical protein
MTLGHKLTWPNILYSVSFIIKFLYLNALTCGFGRHVNIILLKFISSNTWNIVSDVINWYGVESKVCNFNELYCNKLEI